jgi:hypothetical protein
MLNSVFEVERSNAMDGRLWDRLYRTIRRACKPLLNRSRMGRPREYSTGDVMAVWAFAALADLPVYKAQRALRNAAVEYWLKRYWHWPGLVPSVSTLSRRARDSEFRWLLRRVLKRFRRAFRLRPTAHVAMD